MALTDKLTNIANAIRAKTGSTTKLSLDEMADTINSIKIGQDISDANISAKHVSNGAIAYGANGKITGTAPWKYQSNGSYNVNTGIATGIPITSKYGNFTLKSELVAPTTWADHSIDKSRDWRSLAYGNGRFVAISYGDGFVTCSTNKGQTWTSSTISSDLKYCEKIIYGKKFFAAVGNNAMRSTDGITWEYFTLPISPSCYGYGNGYYVMVSPGFAAYSTDSSNWTKVTTSHTEFGWKDIAYGNGRFVAINNGGASSTTYSNKVIYSTDNGKTWTASTLPKTGKWDAIVYGKGYFIACDSKNYTTAYSTDGITWSTGGAVVSQANGLAYGELDGMGRFIAIRRGSKSISYSDNGISWQSAEVLRSTYWSAIAYGEGRFVAINDSLSAAYEDLKVTLALKSS